MNILVLLTVVCCSAAVPLLSWNGGQKETFGMVNGSSTGNMIIGPSDERGAIAVAAAVSEWASKFLNALSKQTATAKLNSISVELNEISKKMVDLKFLSMKEGDLDCLEEIRYYGEMLASDRHGLNEMLVSNILDFEGGIHKQLFKLNDLMSDSATFGDGFGDAYEPFFVKLIKMYTHYRDMENSVPNKDLRKLMLESAIPKLFTFQALGYEIEYNATILKMNSTNGAAIKSKLAGLYNEHERRVKQQTIYISKLLKDCPEKKWLQCTDGVNFGSICYPRCFWFEPEQCLWNGKWSREQSRPRCVLQDIFIFVIVIGIIVSIYYCFKFRKSIKSTLSCLAHEDTHNGIKTEMEMRIDALRMQREQNVRTSSEL